MYKIAFVLLWGALILTAQTPSGSIQGVVVDSNKSKPIGGAFVIAMRNGLPPLSQTVKTAADGSFQVQALPAGKYSLCVQVAGGGYVDPCIWNPDTPPLSLAEGQRSTGNTVRVQPGSVLRLRLQDPGGLLRQQLPNGYLPHVNLGVVAPRGFFLPAHTTGSDNGGSDLRVTVPFDANLKLSISSPHLKLADSGGVPLPNNASQQAFEHRSADPNPKSFSYTITGRVP